MAEVSNKKSVLHSGNKSRKSKNDLIRSAVGHYLKEKSHVGNEKIRKSDFVLLQNKKQFVFNKMIEGDLVNGNSFGYSNVLCINNNQQMVDQQFGKFTQFIELQNEGIKEELRRFCGPVICHFYLELLKAGEHKAAIDFLKKNAHFVAPVENYEAPLPTKVNGCSVSDAVPTGLNENLIHSQIKFAKIDSEEPDMEQEFFINLIHILSNCAKYDTAENNEEVRLFRGSKHELYITEEAFDTLNKFLHTKGHVLILNLIYTWLHLNIVDNEVHQWNEDHLFHGPDEDDDELLEQGLEIGTSDVPVSSTIPSDTSTPVVDNDELSEKQKQLGKMRSCLQTVQESIKELLQAQATFPRFVKVSDKCRGLTSADLDSQGCHLVAGFNSSILQLWQLNQRTVGGRNIYERIADSTCKWELNNVYDVEDEIESAVQMEGASCNERQRTAEKEEYMAGKYEENSIGDYGGLQLRGHSRGVTDVLFSTHYPLLYSVSKDGTMRSWRSENYSCASVYRGHNYPVWCVDESPAGMYTATGSKDLTARLWSLERTFPLITYVGHTQDVESLAFHPNGNYIASASADLSVRLWCVTSGKLMRVFSDCKQPVTSVAFSPDGKMLAAGGEETKIRIFDLAAGSQLAELKDLTATCTSIAWSPVGQRLAATCHDGTMRLWDVSKLSATNDSGSNTAASTSESSVANRLMALTSNCQRLVKVLFSHETLSCIGS